MQLDFHQYLKTLEDDNIIAWIFNNNLKNERGNPIVFDKFSFMIDPYLDWSPHQGVRKCTQIGWSVMTNIKLFYAARHGIPGYGVPAANVIYTLPSDSDVNTFVPSKTNLLIENNPIIKEYIRNAKGDTDSIQRKQVGNSMVYFKGTRSKTAALMLSSDLNIHDEADRSEPAIIEQYEGRLAGSMYKGRWVFSNPSAPNMPADLMYLDSDQKHWFIKCEHCGAWQYLDWYKLSEHQLVYDTSNPHCFIDDTQGLYVCGKCASPISDDNRQRGKWVKKFKDKSISGYWISHFMCSWITAKELLRVERDKSKAYFMNFVRGLPYVGSDVTIDAQTIINNMVLGEHTWTKGKVAMGVDNGDTKHYVIGDAQGIFEVGKTRDWDQIERLIEKYEPTCVIDLNPYPNKPRELAKKYRPRGNSRWRVYCSFYIEQSKNYELIDWGSDDKAHMVYPVRNLLFDDLIAYISNGNVKFFNNKAYFEEYISHWETMYRLDMVGTKRAEDIGPTTKIMQGVWQSSTGNDHYAHATLFYYVALSKIIGGGGQVLADRQDPHRLLQQDHGRIQVVPDVNQGKMKPVRSYIPDLSKMWKQKHHSAATSDTIK